MELVGGEPRTSRQTPESNAIFDTINMCLRQLLESKLQLARLKTINHEQIVGFAYSSTCSSRASGDVTLSSICISSSNREHIKVG
ncbi:hypothetical protein H5410_017341 [Solanum commersonii]|uniref:Uncharacterized protein n=1 Tax=Solanum commersonii TaxID=4109 RepID=A0A9J5ZYW1_SOLCO|nr:hypothetical protein H5410_017341 [Solanum commersonii]